jgi:hypothetical protein
MKTANYRQTRYAGYAIIRYSMAMLSDMAMLAMLDSMAISCRA